MPVNTDSSRRFDVARIVRLALQVSGLVSIYEDPDETLFGQGRDFLDLVLDELATDGVTAKTASEETVAVVSGTSAYQLSASTLDVLDPVWWAAAGQAEPPVTQSPVTLISSQRWRELEGASTGTPLYLFAYKGGEAIEARLLPTPSASGTLRLRVHRMLMDAGPGNSTLELAPFWEKFLVQALAGELAQANGMQAAAQLALLRAEGLKKKCLGKDSDNVHSQITWSHPTVWSGR